MPYNVTPAGGGKFAVKRSDTGKTVGTSDTRQMAMKSMAARYAAMKENPKNKAEEAGESKKVRTKEAKTGREY